MPTGWLSELNTLAVFTTSFFDASPIVTGMVGTPRSGRMSAAIRTFSRLQSCAIAGNAAIESKPMRMGNDVVEPRITPPFGKIPSASKARARALFNSRADEETVMSGWVEARPSLYVEI